MAATFGRPIYMTNTRLCLVTRCSCVLALLRFLSPLCLMTPLQQDFLTPDADDYDRVALTKTYYYIADSHESCRSSTSHRCGRDADAAPRPPPTGDLPPWSMRVCPRALSERVSTGHGSRNGLHRARFDIFFRWYCPMMWSGYLF